MIYQLLGYVPDADPTIIGAITGGAGFVPSYRGYKGAPAPLSAGMATLAATCQGAAVLAKLDATTRFFAGTPTKLYEAGSSTWSDVSRAAAYTISSTQRWRFAQFGNVSLAADGADTVQASVSSGAFSCVAGAPVAALVEVVGKFVFAANTSTSAQGIQWAGINGYTSWSASVATQAGSDTLTSTPGPITAIKRFGQNLVVYKKNSMYLGIYVGPPNIWEFNPLPVKAGALSQEAVVDIGTAENPKLISMGEDDWYVYDGSRPVPVGTARLKQTIFSQLLQSRYYACIGLHDRLNSRVYFYYPVSDSVKPDKCVVYHYRMDKWGVDDRQIEAAVEFVGPGLTYDGLGSSYTTYDSLPNSAYDLAFYASSPIQPAIFDTNHFVSTLTGMAGNTSITTGDFGDDSQVSTVVRVRPRFLTKPTSATWTPGYRMNPGDTLTTDTAVTLTSGTFDFTRDARWHRGVMTCSGDWELSDLSIEGVDTGRE